MAEHYVNFRTFITWVVFIVIASIGGIWAIVDRYALGYDVRINDLREQITQFEKRFVSDIGQHDQRIINNSQMIQAIIHHNEPISE